ncbi:hypothetical protein GGF32_008347 [Allomyces javanicus]|nr:hypothetical protein GGF32_008347 [Allomyces javanicus]
MDASLAILGAPRSPRCPSTSTIPVSTTTASARGSASSSPARPFFHVPPPPAAPRAPASSSTPTPPSPALPPSPTCLFSAPSGPPPSAANRTDDDDEYEIKPCPPTPTSAAAIRRSLLGGPTGFSPPPPPPVPSIPGSSGEVAWRGTFTRPVSMSAIGPEVLAAKLDMGTLTREFAFQTEHATKQSRTRRVAKWGVAVVLVLGAAAAVLYWIVFRPRLSNHDTNVHVAAAPVWDLPAADDVKDRPALLVVPGRVGEPGCSASRWAVTPSTAWTVIGTNTTDQATRIAAVIDGAKQALYVYRDCAGNNTKLDAARVSTITVSLTAQATVTPLESYSVAASNMSVTVSAPSVYGLARGLEALVASLVPGGATPGECAYWLCPPSVGTSLKDAPVMPIRGMRVSVASANDWVVPFSPVATNGTNDSSAWAVAQWVDMVGWSKMNSLFVRVPPAFGLDVAALQASPVSRALTTAFHAASQRGVTLIPHLESWTANLRNTSWAVACPALGANGTALDLTQPAVREAHATWVATWRAQPWFDNGNLWAGVHVGHLLHPDHWSCILTHGAGVPQSASFTARGQVAQTILDHLTAAFNGLFVFYDHPNASTALNTGGLLGTRFENLTAVPEIGVDPSAGSVPSLGSNPVVLARYTGAAATDASAWPASVAATSNVTASVAAMASAGMVVDVPAAMLSRSTNASMAPTAEWVQGIAGMAWRGWVNGSTTAKDVADQARAFAKWVVRPRTVAGARTRGVDAV